MSKNSNINSLDNFRKALKSYDMQINKERMEKYYFENDEPEASILIETDNDKKSNVNGNIDGFFVNIERKPELCENVFKKKLLSKLKILKL